MSKIESYIEEMKIKKVFVGGFDKESVYTSMQGLYSKYQKDIIQIKTDKERLETELKKSAIELEQANKDIQLLKFQLEEELKRRNEYDVRFNALTQAIDAINASKEKVIEESKRTAEGIVAEANEKFESVRQECLFQKQQKDLALSKMMDVKQRFNISMEKLRSGLMEMLSECDDLQKNSLEQALGEDEIDEKTENGEIQIVLNDEANRLVQMMTGCVSEHDNR